MDKDGFGLFYSKLFVQVLLANLLSIGLTFGTTAFFEYKKRPIAHFDQ